MKRLKYRSLLSEGYGPATPSQINIQQPKQQESKPPTQVTPVVNTNQTQQTSTTAYPGSYSDAQKNITQIANQQNKNNWDNNVANKTGLNYAWGVVKNYGNSAWNNIGNAVKYGKSLYNNMAHNWNNSKNWSDLWNKSKQNADTESLIRQDEKNYNSAINANKNLKDQESTKKYKNELELRKLWNNPNFFDINSKKNK